MMRCRHKTFIPKAGDGNVQPDEAGGQEETRRGSLVSAGRKQGCRTPKHLVEPDLWQDSSFTKMRHLFLGEKNARL